MFILLKLSTKLAFAYVSTILSVARFITKTLDSQRKQIEKSERQDQRDTDEEIEHEMANAKAHLANEFEEKANARKVRI